MKNKKSSRRTRNTKKNLRVQEKEEEEEEEEDDEEEEEEEDEEDEQERRERVARIIVTKKRQFWRAMKPQKFFIFGFSLIQLMLLMAVIVLWILNRIPLFPPLNLLDYSALAYLTMLATCILYFQVSFSINIVYIKVVTWLNLISFFISTHTFGVLVYQLYACIAGVSEQPATCEKEQGTRFFAALCSFVIWFTMVAILVLFATILISYSRTAPTWRRYSK